MVCARCGATRMKALRLGVTRVREELEALAGVPVAEVWGPAADEGEDDRIRRARVVVGTEAALHRVPDADAVVVLGVRLRAPGPALPGRRAGLGPAGPRRPTRGGAERAARRRPGSGAGAWSRPASPGTPRWCRRCRPIPGVLAAAEAEVRRALAPSALQRPGGGVGAGRRRLRRRVRTAAPEAVEVRGPVDGTWSVRAPDHADAVRPPGRGAPPAGSAPGGGRPGAGLSRDGAGSAPVRHGRSRYDGGMSRYSIRLYGDPVLRQRAPEVDDIDGTLKQLADDMVADHVRGTRRGPGRAPGRRAEADVRLRHRRRRGPGHGREPGALRGPGGVDLRRGVPVGPGLVVAHRAAQGGPSHRVRPRRQRDLDRGRRVPGPGVPARGRPSRRRAARRAARRRTSARRPSASCGPGPWACPTPIPTGCARSSADERPARHTGL